MTSTPDSSGGGRLSRQAWIDAVLDALVDGGIEAVRIERLSEKLGVTKGSFYHHFASRDDLLEAVTDYWAHTQTDEVLRLVAPTRGDAVEKLTAVMLLAQRRDIGRRDHAMRIWGAVDARAARAVKAADAVIVDLVEKTLAGAGVPRDEVKPLARVLFFTALGAYNAPTLADAASRRALNRYLLRLVRDRAGAA